MGARSPCPQPGRSTPNGGFTPVPPATIRLRSPPSPPRSMPSRPRASRSAPICDGPVHQSRRPQIVFGARGITGLDITLYGPSHELHSGHYGNWAPNPAMALARLLASMKDDDGRVLIDHFYDGIEPLTDTEKRAVAEAPEVDAGLMRELALGRTEGSGKKLVELINLPSLNVRGMASARVGDKASNVVPSTATASIDIRLVKGIDPPTAVRRVLDHIGKQGYEIVETEPDAATRMQY